MKPSWTGLFVIIFIGYILNSVWTLYQLWIMPQCEKNSICFKSGLKSNLKYSIYFFQSSATRKTIQRSSDLKLIDKWDNFDYTVPQEKNLNVSVLREALNNQTLYIYILLVPENILVTDNFLSLLNNNYVSSTSGQLTTYMIPEEKTFNLLDKQQKKKSRVTRPISHWRSKIDFELITDRADLPNSGLPAEIIKFITISPKNEYLPILYINSMKNRITHLQPLNKSSEIMLLNIVYNPISFGTLRLIVQLDAAMKTMKTLGFSEKDADEVKGIFTDTNFYLLCGTFVIAAFHLLFDFLAFKNDIAFWRKKQTMVGVSTRTMVWRCVSQIIIFLHLLDEETTKLILIPAFVGTVIEIWKVFRAFKMTVYWKFPLPRLHFGTTTDAEKQTSNFDAQIMKYLSYVLYPLCIGGAIYSLLYIPHKSCYAWCLQSLVNGVYAFGFIFMLPQLFLNYKLKSVAHLPWRAFMYKAFNTFIDDIFAFIITMPTAHRIACFRDDIVFLIYLYQSWLYPVDKSRVNEYGETYTDDKKEK